MHILKILIPTHLNQSNPAPAVLQIPSGIPVTNGRIVVSGQETRLHASSTSLNPDVFGLNSMFFEPESLRCIAMIAKLRSTGTKTFFLLPTTKTDQRIVLLQIFIVLSLCIFPPPTPLICINFHLCSTYFCIMFANYYSFSCLHLRNLNPTILVPFGVLFLGPEKKTQQYPFSPFCISFCVCVSAVWWYFLLPSFISNASYTLCCPHPLNSLK